MDLEKLLLLIDESSQGDEITINSFTNICRGLVDIEKIVERATDRGVRIRSMEEPWFDMDVWMTDYEVVVHLYHEYKKQYGMAAVAQAHLTGRVPGRAKGISPKTAGAMRKAMALLKKDGRCSVAKACRLVGISTNTFNRYRSNYE